MTTLISVHTSGPAAGGDAPGPFARLVAAALRPLLAGADAVTRAEDKLQSDRFMEKDGARIPFARLDRATRRRAGEAVSDLGMVMGVQAGMFGGLMLATTLPLAAAPVVLAGGVTAGVATGRLLVQAVARLGRDFAARVAKAGPFTFPEPAPEPPVRHHPAHDTTAADCGMVFGGFGGMTAAAGLLAAAGAAPSLALPVAAGIAGGLAGRSAGEAMGRRAPKFAADVRRALARPAPRP